MHMAIKNLEIVLGNLWYSLFDNLYDQVDVIKWLLFMSLIDAFKL